MHEQSYRVPLAKHQKIPSRVDCSTPARPAGAEAPDSGRPAPAWVAPFGCPPPRRPHQLWNPQRGPPILLRRTELRAAEPLQGAGGAPHGPRGALSGPGRCNHRRARRARTCGSSALAACAPSAPALRGLPADANRCGAVERRRTSAPPRHTTGGATSRSRRLGGAGAVAVLRLQPQTASRSFRAAPRPRTTPHRLTFPPTSCSRRVPIARSRATVCADCSARPLFSGFFPLRRSAVFARRAPCVPPARRVTRAVMRPRHVPTRARGTTRARV